MFVFTLGKKGLKRLGAAAVCGVVLCAAVFTATRSLGAREAAATAASAPQQAADLKIQGASQVSEFFQLYGLEIDLASATVDKVKIPKKWDESFSAFNTVVKASGLDLSRSKGKTVEKWSVLCPGRSAGEQSCYGVVLVYKQKPVGAYLLNQPSGEVLGLDVVSQSAAALTDEQAESTAAQFGAQADSQLAETASADGPVSQPEQTVAASADSQDAQMASTDGLEDFLAQDAGAVPVE